VDRPEQALSAAGLDAFMARYADKLVDLDKICHLVKWYRRWADRARADKRMAVAGVYGLYTVPKDPLLSQQEWELILWAKAKPDRQFSEPDLTPSWGEGFMAVAAHADYMPALDRMAFEDCGQGSGRLQRAGLNIPSVPYNRKQESLARRVGCTLDQACDFIDFWTLIDETGGLWPTFEKVVRWLGAPVALVSYERIAGELALIVDERDLGETGAGWEDPESEDIPEEIPAWEFVEHESGYETGWWGSVDNSPAIEAAEP
jgi:hypothetical protein